MKQQSNVVSLQESLKINLNPQTQAWVADCKKAFAKQVFNQFQEVLNRVDDTLFSLADRSDNNQDQTQFFEAMREMRGSRRGVESRFIQGWSNAFDRFWRTGTSAYASKQTALEETEFALVDSQDLEENIAIESMVSKSNNLYQSDLDRLSQRVSYLLHGLAVDVNNNPFAPNNLCYAYQEATKTLAINFKVKLVLGKLFERYFLAELEDSYLELNQKMADFGILPELETQKKRRVVKKSEQEATPAAPEHVVDQQIQAELFQSLQQLLSLRRGEGGVTPVDHGPTFAGKDVLHALTAIQSQAPMDPANPQSMLDLRAILLSEVKKLQSGQGNCHLAQKDSDTLDVVSMIFEFILEDRNLPDAMKAILGRLQIPMLKVSMLDKAFFSRKEHPARRLLNEMAQAGMGWSEEEGKSEGTLYWMMSTIVQRIMSEFEMQISLFEDLLREFRAFVEKDSRSVQAAEKRTNQITQGKEQLDLAKKQALQLLNERLASHYLPEAIRPLLEEGWKDVLMLTYLRQGQDSTAHQAAVQLMDEFLWSLQAKETQEERQALLQKIPPMMKRMHKGLTEISFEPHKMSQLFALVKQHHIGVLKGQIDIPVLLPEQVIRPAIADTTDMEEIVMTEGEVSSNHEQDAYYERAMSLQPGVWLEFVDENSQLIRCKLSWRSDKTNKFVFVNRRGMKVAEMSVNGLAMVLRRDTTHILENVPLMDRAMSAMMSALKGNNSESV